MTSPGPLVQQLLDECDSEARRRSRSLEAQGRLPQGFTKTYYPLTPGEHQQLRRLRAALLAADTWDVFAALAHGRPVPAHRIRARYRTPA